MNPALMLSERYLRARYPVARLLQPGGGLLAGVVRLAGAPTSPDFEIAVTNLDNVTEVFPHVTTAAGEDVAREPLGGAAADVDPEWAWLRAVMEGVERYACMAFKAEEFVLATALDLGAQAIDLDTLPRCSARELADPRCGYVLPDKRAPIRWTRGYSLRDRCERWVPAVMSHLYLRPLPAERFWQMITTGVAAHVSPEAALVSAICEVIERDAIALTWLARLPLPRVAFTRPWPAALAPNMDRLSRSLIDHHFFDATTDVGIPTVYGVQLLPGHEHLAQYVNCATEFDAAAACAKTIREAAPARTVFEGGYRFPDRVEDFTALHDGAAYMGRPEQRPAFDFLIDSPHRRRLDDMGTAAPADAAGRLRHLVARLAAMDMDVVAVDLTTRELRDLGLWVVRAVIPGLMPMTSEYRARFLGTPRLYEYPRRAGYGALDERDVNPYPQPFA
jgi:ribosomal protein S12 methylthiotransferase accessory factor